MKALKIKNIFNENKFKKIIVDLIIKIRKKFKEWKLKILIKIK